MKPGLGGYNYLFSHRFLDKFSVSARAIPVLIQYFLLFVALVLALIRYRKRFMEMVSPERRVVVFYILFISIYVISIVTLLEYGENMRNRLYITPFFYSLATLMIMFFLRLRKSR